MEGAGAAVGASPAKEARPGLWCRQQEGNRADRQRSLLLLIGSGDREAGDSSSRGQAGGSGRWQGGWEVGRKERFCVVVEICFRRGELNVPAGATRMPLQMQEGPSGQGFAPKMWRRASHA